MTDRELAEAFVSAQQIERKTRALMQTENLAERDAALNVMRLAVALRRSLETWMALRTLRAELKGVGAIK